MGPHANCLPFLVMRKVGTCICSKWDYRRRKEASSFSFSNWSKYIMLYHRLLTYFVWLYKLLSSLLAPVKPELGEKFYKFLVDTLSKHFNPAPSEIVERFKFHTRFRKPGESVTAFVSELHSLAKSSCNFQRYAGNNASRPHHLVSTTLSFSVA